MGKPGWQGPAGPLTRSKGLGRAAVRAANRGGPRKHAGWPLRLLLLLLRLAQRGQPLWRLLLLLAARRRLGLLSGGGTAWHGLEVGGDHYCITGLTMNARTAGPPLYPACRRQRGAAARQGGGSKSGGPAARRGGGGAPCAHPPRAQRGRQQAGRGGGSAHRLRANDLGHLVGAGMALERVADVNGVCAWQGRVGWRAVWASRRGRAGSGNVGRAWARVGMRPSCLRRRQRRAAASQCACHVAPRVATRQAHPKPDAHLHAGSALHCKTEQQHWAAHPPPGTWPWPPPPAPSSPGRPPPAGWSARTARCRAAQRGGGLA